MGLGGWAFYIHGLHNGFSSSILSKRKSKRLYARIEKFNFKRSIFDRSLLANQLVTSRYIPSQRRYPSHQYVSAVVLARATTVNSHLEAYWLAVFSRPQH